MIKKLVNRLVAGSVAAGAALVAVVALGATLFYALCLVVTPLGASAITAGVFALIAVVAYLVFANKAAGEREDDHDDDEEPEGIPGRLLQMVQQRPVVGVVAALAAGAILFKKPGLAALALSAFNDHDSKSSRSRGRSHKSRRRR